MEPKIFLTFSNTDTQIDPSVMEEINCENVSISNT